MSDYWNLPGFKYLYLEDSWVTGIHATPTQLEIEVDFVLREEHPAYAIPAPGEQHCYRAGTIWFTGVSVLRWEGQGRAAALDAAGECDYGSIDTFDHDGNGFTLTGDFGRIQVVAGGLPAVVLR